MEGVVTHLKKIIFYTTFTFAGIIFFSKSLNFYRWIDKKFLNKHRRKSLQKLKYLFFSIDFEKTSYLHLSSFSTREDKIQFANRQEKLSKMKNVIDIMLTKDISITDDIKRETSTTTGIDYQQRNNTEGSHNDDEYSNIQSSSSNRYNNQQSHSTTNTKNDQEKFDKKDKLFFSLFQGVSNIYAKNNHDQVQEKSIIK